MLLEIQAAVLEDASISDKRRGMICTQLADADKCLVDGADETLQMLNVASIVQQVLNGKFG
jgi:replication factor C subunit 2/4